VFYASAAMLFLGAFAMRYRLELVLSFPFTAVVMALYLTIAFRPDSAVLGSREALPRTGFHGGRPGVRGRDGRSADRRHPGAVSDLPADVADARLAEQGRTGTRLALPAGEPAYW
jgi:hypothetical protein